VSTTLSLIGANGSQVAVYRTIGYK